MNASMAKARILAPWVGREEKSAIYHTVSRVVEKRKHFGKIEKEQFVELMRIYEIFCEVKVLNFCVMSNHYHILVEVPPRPVGGISDDEILKRLSLVQKPGNVAIVRKLFESYQEADLTEKGKKEYEALREKYLCRMWDLGQFMKSVKQQFSRWFNKKNDRKGTLWEERYSSSLVEDGYVALVISAYIDLNPVRAGIVDDPKDYRWSSYGEAVAGGQKARAGIARILQKKDFARLSLNPASPKDQDLQMQEGLEQQKQARPKIKQKDQQLEGYEWRSIAGRYRVFLFEEGRAPGQGQQTRQVQGVKRSQRKGFSKKQIDAEKVREGELSVVTKLHCRTRALIDGAVLGSRGFVEGVISQLNEQKYWEKPRKTGGHRLKISGVPTESSNQPDVYRDRQENTFRNTAGEDLVSAGASASKNAASSHVSEAFAEEIWSLRHLKKE